MTAVSSQTIVAGAAMLTVLSASGFAASIQPFRDHLRQRYGFEPPEYYDKLPADTDANRKAVTELLVERDREKAEWQKEIQPKPLPELPHGRTSDAPVISCVEWGGCSSEPPERPLSLAGGYEIKKQACHLDWGLLDRLLDLCRSVDVSAGAAEHYARDVESYWSSRLRPEPLLLLSPSAKVDAK